MTDTARLAIAQATIGQLARDMHRVIAKKDAEITRLKVVVSDLLTACKAALISDMLAESIDAKKLRLAIKKAED